MRFSSFRYLVREGFRNIGQNFFMSLASIGVLISCLLLTGTAYLVFVNIQKACDWVYGQNVVVAFAKADCTGDQVRQLQDKIEGITNVESVQFISKQDTLLKYKDTIPEATYEDMQGDNNPFLDSYIITFKDLSVFDQTVQQIQQIPEIDSMSYNREIAAMLTKVRTIILWAGGAVIALLFLVSIFIIINTIKLTVYNRRLEISIMKSVGATNAFVRTPFVIEGMVLGLAAAFLAYGLIFVLYRLLAPVFHFGMFQGLMNFSAVWQPVLFGFLGIGILTGVIGSAISIGKYLKEEGGISRVL